MILAGPLSSLHGFVHDRNSLSALNIKEKEWGREKTALVLLQGAALTRSRLCFCNMRMETISIPPPVLLPSNTYRSLSVSHPGCPHPRLVFWLHLSALTPPISPRITLSSALFTLSQLSSFWGRGAKKEGRNKVEKGEDVRGWEMTVDEWSRQQRGGEKMRWGGGRGGEGRRGEVKRRRESERKRRGNGDSGVQISSEQINRNETIQR